MDPDRKNREIIEGWKDLLRKHDQQEGYQLKNSQDTSSGTLTHFIELDHTNGVSLNANIFSYSTSLPSNGEFSSAV